MSDYEDDFDSGEDTDIDEAEKKEEKRKEISENLILPINEEARHDRTSSCYNSDNSEDDHSENFSPEESDNETNNFQTEDSDEKENNTSVRRSRQNKHVDFTTPERHLTVAERKVNSQIKRGKNDEATRNLVRCVALCRILYGDGSWRLGRAHANLATGYLELKGYAAQAGQHAQTARRILMSGNFRMDSGERPEMLRSLVSTYFTLGRATYRDKKYGDSQDYFKNCEKALQEWSRDASSATAATATVAATEDEISRWKVKIFTELARASGKLCQPAMAASYLERAIKILEEKHGEGAPQLVNVLQMMGLIEQSRGAHDSAIENLLRAHTINTAYFNAGSPETAATARNLAAAYSACGDPNAESSAESYLAESHSIYSAHLGESHGTTLTVGDEIAKLMLRTERPEEALKMLRQSLRPKAESFGDFSSQVSDTHKLIGSIHLALADTDRALKSLNKCYQLECIAHGEKHRKCKSTKKTIDILLSNPALMEKHGGGSELAARPRFNSVGKSGGKTTVRP